MRRSVLFGLILSSLLIVGSVISSIAGYYYFTTNRVGPVGDGQFHFASIRTFVFLGVGGVLSLSGFLIQAFKDWKLKKHE